MFGARWCLAPGDSGHRWFRAPGDAWRPVIPGTGDSGRLAVRGAPDPCVTVCDLPHRDPADHPRWRRPGVSAGPTGQNPRGR